jgi:hypothetical protein
MTAWKGTLAIALGAFSAISQADAQDSFYDFTTTNGGFVAQNLGSSDNLWRHAPGVGWEVDASTLGNRVSRQRLLSPVHTATASQIAVVARHRYQFQGWRWFVF